MAVTKVAELKMKAKVRARAEMGKTRLETNVKTIQTKGVGVLLVQPLTVALALEISLAVSSIAPRVSLSLPPRVSLSLPPKVSLSLPPKVSLSLPPKVSLSLAASLCPTMSDLASQLTKTRVHLNPVHRIIQLTEEIKWVFNKLLWTQPLTISCTGSSWRSLRVIGKCAKKFCWNSGIRCGNSSDTATNAPPSKHQRYGHQSRSLRQMTTMMFGAQTAHHSLQCGPWVGGKCWLPSSESAV